jgi:hypothetical protein
MASRPSCRSDQESRSDLWRLPTRGAMGSGLRVVAGAVTSSQGSLEVRTRDKRLVLHPQGDGSTVAEVSDAHCRGAPGSIF